ncbi:MAG: hypothetical protein ABI895_05260 [Deltaproteobacteria bacterium]
MLVPPMPCSEMLRWSWRLAFGMLAFGCLPADTRPPPARAIVSVQPSDSLLSGISAAATQDGWAIEYRRFLLGLGRVAIGGDRCTQYSDAEYTRIFDMLQPDTQKVSEHYALGSCDFGFAVVQPSEDSLLGQGVSEVDAHLMRTPSTDPAVPRRGISVYVQGQATRGGVTQRFSWELRRRVAYRDCVAILAGERVSGLELASGEEQQVRIQISGDALFQDGPDPELAQLRFDAFASADLVSGNADGEVSLAELRRVKLADLPEGTYQLRSTADPAEVPGFASAAPTLEDYLYTSALPGVARFRDNGSCEIRVRSRFDDRPVD